MVYWSLNNTNRRDPGGQNEEHGHNEDIAISGGDRIALILALFIPVWIVFSLLLIAFLSMLPLGICIKLTPQPIYIPHVILGSLVIFAVIAILRMVRGHHGRDLEAAFHLSDSY